MCNPLLRESFTSQTITSDPRNAWRPVQHMVLFVALSVMVAAVMMYPRSNAAVVKLGLAYRRNSFQEPMIVKVTNSCKPHHNRCAICAMIALRAPLGSPCERHHECLACGHCHFR